ncbi:putative P-loop containing nucleoside triphosphate hydrolase [Helianthus annuus]|nr:putative P-loop containing nucleoside triphosphate hydrolase [Helianthus annuus]
MVVIHAREFTLDVIDRALLRSGRFGEILYVTLPNQDERGLILKTLSKNCSLDADVDLIAIARSKACENLSGADLKRMVRLSFSFWFDCHP